MWDDSFYEQVREAIRVRSQKPAKEWFQDLVSRGIIDDKGNVLVRLPHLPIGGQNTEPPPGAVSEDAAKLASSLVPNGNAPTRALGRTPHLPSGGETTQPPAAAVNGDASSTPAEPREKPSEQP